MKEIESKKKQSIRKKYEENIETNIKRIEVENDRKIEEKQRDEVETEKIKQQELAKIDLEDNVEEYRRIEEKSG